ncbi:MAG: hypothetical protein H6698_05810 [Myxococcales bacterium]|nr:hypothetical protein [Myxococcales bacterium]
MTEPSDSDIIRLNEYLEGELDEAACGELEAELARRPELARALEELQETVGALGALAAPSPPADLGHKVTGRIRRRSRGRYFDPASQRARTQSQLFALVSLLVLLGVPLIAGPRALEALLGSVEVTALDEFEGGVDGSGDEATPPPEGSGGSAGQNAPMGARGQTAPRVETSAAPELGGLVDEPDNLAAGRVSGAPVVEIERREYVYTVRSTLSRDALRARLRDQFGSERVREADGRLFVAVPRGDVAQTVGRVSDLGEVVRRVEQRPAIQETLDIEFEPGE